MVQSFNYYVFSVRTHYYYVDKSVLEKGIDHWMKKVSNLSEIWDQVDKKESKLPHVIKINFTDNVTNRTGSFYIIDLIQPRFLPLSPTSAIDNDSSSYIYHSFQNLSMFINHTVY